MSRMFHDHNCFLSRTDSGSLRWLLTSSLPTDWRESKADRRMFFPEEVRYLNEALLCEEIVG